MDGGARIRVAVITGSLLLLVGGGIYWISDWLSEKLGWRFKSAPPAPAVSDQSA